MVVRLGIFVRVVFQSGVLLGTLFGVAAAQTGMCGSSSGVCVQTWRQDINLPTGSACIGHSCRTGENLSESTLTYTLSTKTFGQRCSAALDGQVYAQPLIMTNVEFQNNQGNYYNVAYVVTERDTLYAINATPPSGTAQCQVLGSLSLIPSGSPAQYPVDCTTTIDNCATIDPSVGILSTPVININSDGTGTIYVVTETESGTVPANAFYHYLHAVNVQSLQELTGAGSPVQITVSGDSLFSKKHIQRPGLLYVSGTQNGLSYDTVYLAFSMLDG